MEVTRTNIAAHQVELSVKVLTAEMARFSREAAAKLAEQTTIEGFRPGKAPYDVIKSRLGEMAILEEASHLAINKTIDEAINKQVSEEWIGQPQITIIKLAPDNDFEYRALLTLLPTIELGEYKNFGLSSEAVIVSDDEVQKIIDHLAEARVKEAAVDRPAAKGDKVILDIEMFLANVPLEGGQNKDTAVILGKEYLVPGFDEQLIGLTKAEERTFTVHYPANYHQKNIADQEVTFKVRVKDIFSREWPKIDDEFALGFGLKTVVELRSNIKKNLKAEKEEEARQKLERKILEKIVAKATFSDFPESLINNELEVMLHELEHNVAAAGGKFKDYLASLNKSTESLKQELEPQAKERIKIALVLRSIIEKEELTLTDQEITDELAVLRKRYEHSAQALETINAPAYRQHLQTLLLNRKVISNLVSWNSA